MAPSTAVFELPDAEQPNFVFGKLRDLVTLALIGVVLLVTVAVAGFVAGFSKTILNWLDLGSELSWLVYLLAIALGLAANSLLFFAMFKLLANPHMPRRSLWSGALLGAVAFEVLKQVSSLLLGLTKNSPAFQAFGIALILVVWINYFSRVVMYAAAWAYTTPAARALRIHEPAERRAGPRDAVAHRAARDLRRDGAAHLAQAVRGRGRPHARADRRAAEPSLTHAQITGEPVKCALQTERSLGEVLKSQVNQ